MNESDLPRVAQIVRQEMENALRLSVKFPVKMKVGTSWDTSPNTQLPSLHDYNKTFLFDAIHFVLYFIHTIIVPVFELIFRLSVQCVGFHSKQLAFLCGCTN